MSQSLAETKRRISSIASTEKITSAMKLVASVKLRRWRLFYEANSAYYTSMKETMERVLDNLSSKEAEQLTSILVPFPDSESSLYILVSSDLGLCGGYNYGLFRLLDTVLTDKDDILFIGNKGYLHYKNKSNVSYLDYLTLANNFDYENVKQFRHFLVRLYKERKYKCVCLVHTTYINSLNFEPTITPILPLQYTFKKEEKTDDSIIFEPNIEDVVRLIIPHYIDSFLYNKIIESVVCESASRRNSMEAATKNADDMLDKLQIEYNKARQAKITQEIVEITAGQKGE